MTNEQWDRIKHFKKSEVVSPDTGEEDMDFRLMEMLDSLREYVGTPLIITSGYRTQAHNASLKHSSTHSRHIIGNAVDIAVNNAVVMGKIVSFALTWKCGTKVWGLGIGKNFVHIDNDANRQEFMVWGY